MHSALGRAYFLKTAKHNLKESLVAYLGGTAPVETYKLFPSDESTQFGDWVKAGALKAGDQLSVRSGVDAVAGDQTVTVKSTTQTHTPHRVYNLEINSQNNQITHNYFVGKNELWVHNSNKKEVYNRKQPAPRYRCKTRKKAYQRAKLQCDPGEEPIGECHPGGKPHFHPIIKGKRTHDHYYFPKRFW